MLTLENLTVCYGSLTAVDCVSLTVEEGEMVAILGANGAGKSTLLGAVAGLVPASTGSVRFMGREIANIGSHRVVAQGVSLVPEGRQVVGGMSVEENLILGAYLRRRVPDLEETYRLFPALQEKRGQLAGLLSGGEQQMLAIGRALVANPRLLMVDEPSLGLAPLLAQQVLGILSELQKAGMTILLVEQNAHQALRLADRAYLLSKGRVAASGYAKQILQNNLLKDVYLGEKMENHQKTIDFSTE